MKILFYYYVGGGGGLSNVIQLLRAMARTHPEDHIDVVTSPDAGFDALKSLPNVRIHKVRITGVREVDRFLLGIGRLAGMARALGSDVVWSLNLGSYVATRVPAVLSVHNPHQVYPGTSAEHSASRLHLAVLRWFFRRSLRRSAAAIVQTPVMGAQLSRVAGSPRDICIAAKAVENERDVVAELLPDAIQAALDGGLGRAAFTFLYVATWSPHKNHRLLAAVFRELAQRGIVARVLVTISAAQCQAAGGPEMTRLIAQGAIVPLGWVGKAHLRGLYAASDACLMPSLLESLSSAHLEAMQWDRAQLTADLPYARDLCGDAALYASPTDPQAWATQAERLMRDPGLRRGLIEAGHARMKTFPSSWDDAAERVRGFLGSVVATAAGRPEANRLPGRPAPPLEVRT